MLVGCHVVLIPCVMCAFLVLSLCFNQAESDFSGEEASDDACDPEYVPDSDSDTEDEEPINSLAAEETAMDTSSNCNVTEDTHETQQPSTSVVRTGQNFCFICKKVSFQNSTTF